MGLLDRLQRNTRKQTATPLQLHTDTTPESEHVAAVTVAEEPADKTSHESSQVPVQMPEPAYLHTPVEEQNTVHAAHRAHTNAVETSPDQHVSPIVRAALRRAKQQIETPATNEVELDSLILEDDAEALPVQEKASQNATVEQNAYVRTEAPATAAPEPKLSRLQQRLSKQTPVSSLQANSPAAAEKQSVSEHPQSAIQKPAKPALISAKGIQPAEAATHDDSYFAIKSQIHERLIETLDLAIVETLPAERLRDEIGRLVEKLIREEYRQTPLNSAERRSIVIEIQDEVLGLGPLEPLLQDPTVSDILINNYCNVYVERRGKLEKESIRFKDDAHLRKIIDRIVSRIGRRVDESSPMVDARLEDGSRVNAIIPPLALDGPSVSIRRFSKDPLELDDLIKFSALTPEIGEVLKAVVGARLNILVSGGTGSGKTTMLNCLSRFVPHDERIVTIEDAAELQLKQDHVVRLETRPANIEGHGEVNARDLVKNCLRMRPDRIIVGEVRSSEVLDMLQAMNTGHDGSLTTIHANSPRDCLMRLETMVAMSGLKIASTSLKRYIASAIDVIIQVNRLSDGSRKLVSLVEITGMEGEAITTQEIFRFKQTGIDENNKVIGQFEATGVRPKFSDQLKAQGFDMSVELFDPTLKEAS